MDTFEQAESRATKTHGSGDKERAIFIYYLFFLHFPLVLRGASTAWGLC
jgi:hypothetical protein